MRIEMKPGDWLILLVSCLLVPLSWQASQHDTAAPSSVTIHADDRSPLVYPLDRNTRIDVKTDYGSSVVEIRDSRVRIASSSCQNKVCMYGGWHQHSGTHLVCLPNRISVSLHADGSNLDGISF